MDIPTNDEIRKITQSLYNELDKKMITEIGCVNGTNCLLKYNTGSYSRGGPLRMKNIVMEFIKEVSSLLGDKIAFIRFPISSRVYGTIPSHLSKNIMIEVIENKMFLRNIGCSMQCLGQLDVSTRTMCSSNSITCLSRINNPDEYYNNNKGKIKMIKPNFCIHDYDPKFELTVLFKEDIEKSMPELTMYEDWTSGLDAANFYDGTTNIYNLFTDYPVELNDFIEMKNKFSKFGKMKTGLTILDVVKAFT